MIFYYKSRHIVIQNRYISNLLGAHFDYCKVENHVLTARKSHDFIHLTKALNSYMYTHLYLCTNNTQHYTPMYPCTNNTSKNIII